MWGQGPPKDNLESWQDIRGFIAEHPDDDDYWSEWKPMVRECILALEAHGLAKHFRVGQSMHDIILSTAHHHRLTSEPRVTLVFQPRERSVRIAYSYAHIAFSETVSQDTVPIASAPSNILVFLRRLWTETHPTEPFPAV